MKTLLRIVLGLVVLLVIVGVIVYADGSRLPVNHSISVEGTVAAPPARVFGLITDVANGPKWRHEVQTVTVLPPEEGRDHWVEDLGHGVTMKFLALRTEPLTPAGNATRAVELQGGSEYGGTWIYEVTPGATPNETHLHITEEGYINSAIYRFMMTHIFGPTKNLDQYMKDIQAAAKA